VKRKIDGVDYREDKTPADYKCDSCGATGVKLWREYQTFADCTELRCARCAAKVSDKDISNMEVDGSRKTDLGKIDQIGWYVPAIPVEGQNTYWGYSSVPDEGVKWWRGLPNFA